MASIIQNETNNTARMLRGHLIDLKDQVPPESLDEIEKSRLLVRTSIESLASLALEDQTKAMVAKVRGINDRYTEAVGEVIALKKIEKLLAEAQALTEELQTQSEELNVQQEELISINEKLEEQYKNSELKTRELEKTKVHLKKPIKTLSWPRNINRSFWLIFPMN